MEAVLPSLLSSGPLGVFAAVFLYLYLQKDKELAAERKDRIADAKSYAELALKLQERALSAIDLLKHGLKPGG